MATKIYQVDAFSEQIFGGNPAAVVPLNSWLPDERLQAIALENNLSETAFYVQNEEGFDLRWFTPTTEVALCGHATLSAAHVLFEEENYCSNVINFYSRYSGLLKVYRTANGITLNFPADEIKKIPLTKELMEGFQYPPYEAYMGKTDIILVFDSEQMIQTMKVAIPAIERIDARGVIITAPGYQVDFVSRFFAPKVGVPEDPVTGSAHTSLTVLWSLKMNKTKFVARQLSKRGGELNCEILENRVLITGKAVTYLRGEINY
ncbi:PhzF family phenazine biosynthesis protein [Mongoliitalea lutea]|nr:PhzF family phenazine biosynthesis protein [Mongoliitalea lutea]